MQPTIRGAAPGAGPSRARSRRQDAYVISGDDSFLLELGPVLGDSFRTRPVESPADVTPTQDSQWLAFVDANRPDARALVAALEKAHPSAPLIVVAPDGTESQWKNAVTRGSICAVVARSELNTAALSEAIARAERRIESQGSGSASSIAASPFGGAGDSRGRWTRLALIVLPVLLLAAAGSWWLLRDRSTPAAQQAASANRTAAAVASGVTRTAPAARAVPELLSDARVAFGDQDNLLPRADGANRGSNALDLYAQVLAQDAANEEAHDGLRRLYTVARSRMQSDLAAGRLDEAQRMLNVFKSAGLEPDETRALESDINAARPRWQLAQLRRAIAAGDMANAESLWSQLSASGIDRNTLADLRRALDARAIDTDLQSQADAVRAAITAGNLLDPAPNNARSLVLAMRQQNRTHAATAAAQRELQLALVARGRDALRQQQNDSAQRYATAAAEFGNSNELGDLRRQLQVEADQAAARAADAAAATVATATVATAPAPAPQRIVTARPARALNVVYPEKAAAAGQQGYVVVEFQLHADGGATDASVVESQPAAVFDKAATDAVLRGRFDTSVLGDDRQPRRARIRVTFKPSA
jgi:TonB family protein